MEYQRPSPFDQAKFVKQVEQDVQFDSAKGDIWYLVEGKWFEKWKSYVGYDDKEEGSSMEVPDRIDNNPLLAQGSMVDVRPGLLEGEHYYLVHEKVWKAFSSWFGGGPEIQRQMIEMGKSKQLMVEVYPMSLKVYRLLPGGLGQPITVSLSRKAKLEKLFAAAGQQLSVPPHKARFWLVNQGDTDIEMQQLKDSNILLEELGLMPTSYFIFESQLPDASWMTKEDVLSAIQGSKTTNGGAAGEESQRGGGDKMNVEFQRPTSHREIQAILDATGRNHGVCGLSNLGNTCFMNSALQCLSNTAPLTMYFLADRYKGEINKRNPLGMEGQIALSYADLIKKMWSGKNSSVAPSTFKHVLGRFAPQFEGYRQHDSQELLAFLLDGLHEDLNRVLEKPYVASVESNGRPDEEVANEAWESHLRRNMSIIVDYFQGQLKSTVTCPDCSKVSITFDPFMYLSLPLPTESYRNIKVTVYPAKGLPLICAVQIPKKQGNIFHLKTLISELLHMDPEDLVVADVYLNKIHTFRADTQNLEQIRDSDKTAIYELPEEEEEEGQQGKENEDDGKEKEQDKTKATSVVLPIVQRKPGYGGNFGEPRVVVVSPGMTNRQLYSSVYRSYSYLIRKVEESSEDPMEVEGKDLSDLAAQSFKIVPIVVSSFASYPVVPFDDAPVSKWYTGKERIYLGVEWLNPTKLIDEKEVVQIHSSVSASTREAKSGVHLEQCLKLFMTQEKLGKDDEWYCPQCKELKQATKKFDLWKTPEILVVHLKRFQYNKWYRDKLDTFVDAPLTGWDLRPFVNGPGEEGVPPPVYDLFAVSNHSGGLGGGHYTAYAKNFADGRWYSFNDSSSREVDGSGVVSAAAYVLFYQRRRPNSDESA